MNDARFLNHRLRTVVLALACVLVSAPLHEAWSAAKKHNKQGAVWAVYFFSKDCPHCDSVRGLLNTIRRKYPLRVRFYDIGRKKNYALFSSMEAIHSEEGFSVPLVIVGDSILMGDKDIGDKLEGIVRKLARSGGARLPYLGEPARAVAHKKPACPNCREKGRPPSVGEEWRKLKVLIDKVF